MSDVIDFEAEQRARAAAAPPSVLVADSDKHGDDPYPYATQRRKSLERIVDLLDEVREAEEFDERDEAVEATIALLLDREEWITAGLAKAAEELDTLSRKLDNDTRSIGDLLRYFDQLDLAEQRQFLNIAEGFHPAAFVSAE
jgi:hypothetical protein